MRQRLPWRPIVLVASAVLVCQYALFAQTPAKRPLTYDVYESWKSIGGTKLSADGQWLAYAVTSLAEDGDMIVRHLSTGQETHYARGTGPTFTPDSKTLLFTVSRPRAEENAAGQGANAAPAAGAAPEAGAGGQGRAGGGPGGGAGGGALSILTLATGQVQTVDRVSQFRLADDSSTWLAYRRGNAGGRNGGGGGRNGGGAPGGAAGGGRAGGGNRAGGGAPAQGAAAPAAPGATQEKRKDPGTDLIIRNLSTGAEETVPEVTDFVWNKDASWMVYAVSSATPENDGVFMRKTADGSSTAVQKGHGNYRGLALDATARQLLFLSDQAEYEKKVPPYRVYYWKVGDAAATEIVTPATRGIAAGMSVNESSAPRFSNDGARVYLTVAPPPAPPIDPTLHRTNVDLWTYKDPMIQPMQQVRANQDRSRSYRAVVHLADKRFVQLATPDLPNVNPGDDPLRTLGTSDVPYQQEMSWDQTYNDIYLIDIKTGVRKKILEHFGANATLSPGGNYVLYFDETGGNWFTYRVSDGSRTNLTANLPVKFWDQGHDTPDQPPALGVAGWTDADKSVLLNDEFDIWEIRPDGSGARMVTAGEGRKQHLVFRYTTIGEGGGGGGGGRGGGGGNAQPVSATKPLLLSTVNDETRASGYYRTTLNATTAPEKIMMIDKQVGGAMKAKDADVVVMTEQKFDEFPDLWVTDTNFTTPKKISNANPQQSEFVWGKSERIKYINGDGKVLSAILIKPDNFDPAKKYPLMVYIYEELSEGLHGYRAPNVGTNISITRYVSNGYVVLEPDIVYETGYPGPSAMKCVIPAVNTVVAQGYIDPKRIGIQGHSWGGYQITYMITQTDMFAAVEAGASVSNMISAYGGIRWGTGMVREFQYEKTQSRIGAAPWDAPLQFIENSPIFWVERIHTPYLTIHNDADDAVPWYQGIEFNTAMRRLGKEAYMFSFNGEPHGLRNRDNMKYWTVHMDEYFDHFLLGAPKPEWMDKGVPFLQKGTRDVSPLFKKKPVNAPAAGKGGGS